MVNKEFKGWFRITSRTGRGQRNLQDHFCTIEASSRTAARKVAKQMAASYGWRFMDISDEKGEF